MMRYLLGALVLISATAIGLGQELLEDGSIKGWNHTNRLGDVFTDLKVIKVVPEGIQCSHKYGLVTIGWGRIPKRIEAVYLPKRKDAEIKELEDAAAIERFKIESARNQADVARRKRLREQADQEELRQRQENYTKGQALWIRGKILQKIQEGLLVESEGGHTGHVEINRSPISGITTTNVVGGMGVFRGSCLLRNHPEYGRFVDGDSVDSLAWDDGQYRYTTVRGAGRTIRAFKCQ